MIVKGGPADVAGVEVGERVLEVDGHSITSEAGALALARSSNVRTLKLKVAREGGEVREVVLRYTGQ